jgi:hypothetical protein
MSSRSVGYNSVNQLLVHHLLLQQREGEEEGLGDRPSFLEELEMAMLSVKFCARQRRSRKKVVQWRPAVKTVVAVLPVAGCAPLF